MTYKTMLLIAGCALFSPAVQAQVTIDIDALERGPKVSPMLYGIFYEDINHAADGGIYAELIRNRSFEDGPRYGAPADMQGWSVDGKAHTTHEEDTAAQRRPAQCFGARRQGFGLDARLSGE